MAGTVSLSSIGKADPAWKIAIVRSMWHPECMDALLGGACEELKKSGIVPGNILVIDVPGSFEIPLMCQHIIKTKRVDAVIALGVIVQGQTHHARLVAEQAAAGVMRVQLETGVPIAFEVLFVEKMDDAKARSSGEHGKGPLAARTALATLAKLTH